MVVEACVCHLAACDSLSAPKADCPFCRELILFTGSEYLEVKSRVHFHETGKQ